MFALASFPGPRMGERTSWYPLFVLVCNYLCQNKRGNGIIMTLTDPCAQWCDDHWDQRDITAWQLARCCPDLLATLHVTNTIWKSNASLHKDLLNPVGSCIWMCLSLHKWWKWKLPVWLETHTGKCTIQVKSWTPSSIKDCMDCVVIVYDFGVVTVCTMYGSV